VDLTENPGGEVQRPSDSRRSANQPVVRVQKIHLGKRENEVLTTTMKQGVTVLNVPLLRIVVVVMKRLEEFCVRRLWNSFMLQISRGIDFLGDFESSNQD
jgi:hypothetical protein